MSILIREKSRIKLFTNTDDYITYRTQDIIFDHIDDIHVRISKLFPFCTETEEPGIESFKRFHLRFYIPISVYQDKLKKLDKCFILFNGLDEIDYFTLYDQIGKGLCAHGYGAVLLPLPDHLNRNMAYRKNEEADRKRPSAAFIDEPDTIYGAYIQVINEVAILISHLLGRCECTNTKECCSFFNLYFSDEMRISLLGYSIGGLAALSNLLVHDVQFNSCILLNAGAKLSDIDVSEFQNARRWKQTVKSLADKHYDRHGNVLEDKLFDMIFLGNRLMFLKDELQDKSRRVLFILSGADTVSKYRSIREIQPDKHGLATLLVPGLHHFLSVDTHWDQWFPVVNEMIRSFDEIASKESLLPNDILGSLAYFQLKYRISENLNHYDIKRVTDNFERNLLSRTLYAARGTYGNVSVALAELYQMMSRAQKRPHLYPDYIVDQYSFLFGSIAHRKFNISIETIEQVVNDQFADIKKGVSVNRIGSLLFNKGYLSEQQIEEIINEQKCNRN